MYGGRHIRTASPPVDFRYFRMRRDLRDAVLSVTNATLPYFWRSASGKTPNTVYLVEPACITCSTPGMAIPETSCRFERAG